MFKKLIKYVIYGLVFLMPLFWLPFSIEAFSFNKVYLLFFLVTIGILAWLAKMIFQDKAITFRKTPLDLFVLGFLLIMILSAVFSKDRVSSVLGFYGRFWPSLLGLLSLGGLYFLLTNNVGKRKITEEDNGVRDSVGVVRISQILNVFLLSSAVMLVISYVSILGLWRFLGRRLPLALFSRAFNPLANSLEGLSMFLAFLIVLLIGLFAFQRRTRRNHAQKFLKYFLLIAGLVLLAIIDFWPAWLCLALALLLFLFFAFWKRIFKKNVNRLTLSILCLLIALIFVFGNPLQVWLSQNRFVGNLPSEVLLKQKASWNLAWQSLKRNPLLGSGISNFSYAFSKFKPKAFLEDNPLWHLRLDRAGNHMAELVATTGLIGVFGYLALVAMFLLTSWSLLVADGQRLGVKRYRYGLPLVAGFLALLIGQFVYYQNATLSFCLWLMLALAVAGWPGRDRVFDFNKFPEIGLALRIFFWLILIVFGFLSFKLTQYYLADLYYKEYLASPFENLNKLKKAARLADSRSVYHIVLARAYLTGFAQEIVKTEPDPQTLNNMVALAVIETRKAAEISPNRVAAYEVSGIVYRDIRGVAQGAVDWAIKSFEKALTLEPNNPVFLTELGKLYLAKEQKEKAIALFEKAIDLKKDYTDGYLQLALLDEKKGDLEQAQARLESLVEHNPFSVKGRFQLGRLYYNINELSLAEEQFLAGLQLFPSHSNSLYSLGLLYEKKGQKDKALKMFNKVLDLNPDNQDVLGKIRELQYKPKPKVEEEE